MRSATIVTATVVIALAAQAAGLAQAAGVAQAAGAGRAGSAGRAGDGWPAQARLGSVVLRRCQNRPPGYCGQLSVPLDYAASDSPRITIRFRWFPPLAATRRGARPGRTVLAVEGGPGFATTGTEGAYLAMIGRQLRQSTGLLLVNLRGTGNSTLLNCPGLEHFTAIGQYGRRFDQRVGECGRQLNHTWHYPGGRPVHASDLFNTAYSARDVASVLAALRLRRVDLYGDSYGSWFAQTFASRYPSLLRSVTLDSTYQVLGLRPWYVSSAKTARRAFAQACRRWPACAQLGARPWATFAALASRLRRSPVTGRTTTDGGTAARLTVTVRTLVNLINNAGFDPVVYRDLEAATLALLRHGDQAPLLRIAALSLGFDNTNYPLPEFSDGLYFAVSCTDYAQLFSRTASPAARLRQYQAALRHEPASTFAPFTLAEWTQMDQYTESFSGCLDWPKPTKLIAPITRRPPLVPARLPVLVMSGGLDSLTPRLGGATLVTRQVGRSARLVTFANLTHVTLEDANDACPALVFGEFLRHPARLHRLNVSCAARVTPVHSVGAYPRLLAQAVPATAGPGNQAGPQALRAVTVALASLGDEISRFEELSGGRDRGLRGGTVRFAGSRRLRITLQGVRWVTNATIDGQASWNQSSGWVSARLVVHLRSGAPVRLAARWRVFAAPGQRATVTGSQGARRLVATALAP